MNIEWKITNEDVNSVKAIIEKHKDNPFVINRVRRNVKGEGINLTPETIWNSILQSLLTTQEKSGPGSAVVNLINKKPFPLSLTEISSKSDKYSYIYEVLKSNRLHYYNNKTDWIFNDFNLMTPEYIKYLTDSLTALIKSDSLMEERPLAHQIATDFKGIGPKQSRNFLQMQGLTKYILPIDSRLTTWFNENRLFPFKIDSNSLSSINFYEFIEDGIQELCKNADVYPCILDACIFVSFNKGNYETQFN